MITIERTLKGCEKQVLAALQGAALKPTRSTGGALRAYLSLVLPRQFTKNSPLFHASTSWLPYIPNMRRGFVIQLSSEADLGQSKFFGRVEHVDSGRTDGFRSVDELVTFIEKTVKEIDETREIPESPLES